MIKVPIFFSLNKLGIVGAQKELRKLTNQTKAFGLTSKLSIGAANQTTILVNNLTPVSGSVGDLSSQSIQFTCNSPIVVDVTA